MTDDDKFFERLRRDAATLRYEPDDVMRVRIAAGVRARIAARSAPATVSQLLASWFRPLAASIAALSLAAAIGLAFMDGNNSEPQDASFASNPAEVSIAGGYGVGD